MSSQPSGAILLFPTGTDIYTVKTDFGVIISGESHVIPSSIPFNVSLVHVPQLATPSLIAIPGFSQITGTNPGVNQFVAQYSGTGAGTLSFSAFNSLNGIAVTYTTAGDSVQAEWFNSVQTSITGIEAFILSGLGISGNYVPITGATINGSLTLNGGSLKTAASGTNQIGIAGTPFANIYSDNFIGKVFKSLDGTDTITIGESVIISGDTTVDILSNNNVTISGNNTVNIIAKNSGITISSVVGGTNIAGHVKPTGSFVFDLGSTTQRWRTIYADTVNTTVSQYVKSTGDTMTGSLTMATGTSLITNLINNSGSTLAISSDSNVTITTIANVSISAANIDLGMIDVGAFGTTSDGPISPSASGTLDLGTAASPWGTVYANNLIGLNISGNFVRISGDTMYGDLTMSPGTAIHTRSINSTMPSGNLDITASEINLAASNNIHFDTGPGGTQMLEIGLTEISLSTDIIPTQSGLYDIGTIPLPLRAIYVDNLHLGTLASGSTINGATFGNPTITGTMSIASGASIIALASGSINIGSSGNPFGTLYVGNIVTSESTGNFISKFGDSMIGTLTIGTGSNISAAGSGVSNIGSAALPFGTIWANNINSTGLNGKYVLKTGDTMTGSLVLNTIYSTGTLTISGNQLSQSAEQINLTSTNGPIIVNANTELQLLANSAPNIVINVSGTESFKDIYPDTSGTHSLGTPEKPWDKIYALNIIPVGVSGTGNFVLKIGDNMSGHLTFSSGIGVRLLQSGTSDIGTLANPLKAIYADNLNITSTSGAFVHIIGDTMTGNLQFSNANILGISGPLAIQAIDGNLDVYADNHINLTSSTGSMIFSAGTGQFDVTATGISILGSSAPITLQANSGGVISQSSGYFQRVTSSGVNTIGASGELLSVSGSAVKISLGGSVNYRGTNTENIFYKNVIPSGSGTILIGTASTPFSGAFFQNINGFAATRQVYNEIPAGTVNGINSTFTTLYLPVSGTQRLYKAGLRMMTGTSYDYLISGNMFTFNTVPVSGSNLVIDYERLAF